MRNLYAILICGATGAASLVASAPSTQAAILTFNDLSTGAFVGAQYSASDGVLIAATNNNPAHPNVATIFDTGIVGKPDKDLTEGWIGGNLAGVSLGKILVVAENVDSNGNGLIDKPDDEKTGGNIFFAFDKPVSKLGFDLIDLDLPAPTDYVEFIYNGGASPVSVSVPFSEFARFLSPYYDSTVTFGDRTANRIEPVTAAELQLPSFTKVVFHLGESMSIDNINFTNAPSSSTPEPGIGFLVAGLPVLLGMRRRR